MPTPVSGPIKFSDLAILVFNNPLATVSLIWSQSSNSWHIMPSNFDDIMNRFTKKLQELGLAGMTAEQLQNIDEDKKQQLQQIADEINTP